MTSGVHIDVSLVSDVPGKLDHASIVAYEVGYHGPPRSPKEKKLLSDSGSMNKLKFQIYLVSSIMKTVRGLRLISNDLYKICNWNPNSYWLGQKPNAKKVK